MPVLHFDEALHEYRVDGLVVPSVTQVLAATGVSVDFGEIAGMSRTLGAAIEEKRAIGSALHEDAHAYDDNDLDWTTVDPRVRPYLESWAAFRRNFPHLQPVARERRLWHPELRYAGTLDGVFLDPEANRRVLVDLKVGDPASAACHLQTAAYTLAWNTQHPDQPIYERWGVRLTPELAVPYRIFPYADWSDLEHWRVLVSAYYLRRSDRRATA